MWLTKILRGIGRGGSSSSPVTLQQLEDAVVQLLPAMSVEEVLLVLRVYGLAGHASHLFAAELERHIGLHAEQFTVREALQTLVSFSMLRKKFRQKAFSLFDGVLEKHLGQLDINEAVGFLRVFEAVQLQAYPSREALVDRVFNPKGLSGIGLPQALYLVELVLELRDHTHEIELLTQLNLKIGDALETSSDSLQWENLLYLLGHSELLAALTPANREGLFSNIATTMLHESNFNPNAISALVLKLDDSWDSGSSSKAAFLAVFGNVLTQLLQKIVVHRDTFHAAQLTQISNFYAKLCHEPWEHYLANFASARQPNAH